VATCIVLDRIEPGEPEPDYCVHGRTTCVGGCDEWVWLGSESVEVVRSGQAAPLCKQCAHRLGPPDGRPAANVSDHRRADGPHT
jgi:hypothetical protein